MKELLIITGPTAVGKSAFAVECAKKINGEIISADSMQIYKGLDIGTAKITAKEQLGVSHYMLDIVAPNEQYSVAEYQKAALSHIESIKSRNKIPIIVGGTGLYINSILYPLSFAQKCEPLRQQLWEEYNLRGAVHMHNKLKEYDLQSYETLHANDSKRVIRALEIAILGDKKKHNEAKSSRFDALMIVIDAKREILYDKIDKRVDLMLKNGLIEETKEAIKQCAKQSFQAIGYKEIANYIEGNISYDEAVNLLKKSTRNYAKRQLTWFRKYIDAVWFDYRDLESALMLVEETFINDNK